MRRLLQKLSIWFFRKSFNLEKFEDTSSNTTLMNSKGEKSYGKV